MKTFTFICLFFVGTMFAQKTFNVVSGNWNLAGNWSPTGVPAATDDVTIPAGKTVNIDATTCVAKSVTISGVLTFNNAQKLTISVNCTVNSGGSLNMGAGSKVATLIINGDFLNNGLTDFWKSNVIIAGNLNSPSASALQNQGNVVVGGNIVGTFALSGGDGTQQIYSTNPNAVVDISGITGTVVPGVPPSTSGGESAALVTLVNTVVYGGSCAFTATTPNTSACFGGNASFTVTSAATLSTYKWQVNKEDNNGWIDVPNTAPYSGVTSVTLSITNVTNAMNGYSYRAYVSSSSCFEYSNFGVLTVNSIVSPTFTAVAPICSGGSLSALPTTSINNITGTWSPALNNLATTTYIFTPNGSQCASNTTMAITVNSCSAQTLSSINSYVYTSLVKGAQSYLWEVTTLDENGNPVGLPQTKTTLLRALKISDLPTFLYNTQYSVRSATTVGGVLGSYGTPTIVKTPIPSSTILNVCGTTISSNSTYIYSSLVKYTPGYKYTLTNTVSPFDIHTVTTNLRSFKLDQLSGLSAGATYDVKVEVKNMDGTFLPVVPSPCSITTPAAAGRFAQSTPIALSSDFKVFSYPNPFRDQFEINVSSISQDKVQIKVYDMIGRLVEQKQTTIADLETSKIGNHYQAGVYNVIVSQGENVKTLRVIKR